MYRYIVFAIILIAGVLLPGSVLADDVTITDNSTLTVNYDESGITASVDGLTGALTDTNEIVSTVTAKFFEIVIMLVFVGFALAYKTEILKVISGLIMIFASRSWLDDYQGIAIVLIVYGCYQLMEALLSALSNKSEARGWSQFKEAWENVKGRFNHGD